MFFVFFTEVMRIRGVILWTAISFIGFILGISSLNVSQYIAPFMVFFVCTFFIMSSTFSLNNYYDVETDRKNPRRKHINALVSNKISKETGVFLNAIFIIIPLLISFFYQFEVFLFCAYLLFLGWIYSAPPFRLKGRPILDVLLHFLGFSSYIIWGSLIAGSIGLISWLVALSIGVWSSIGQVNNHINDYLYDKESETKTFAVWIGLDKAKTTIEIITLLHLILLIPLIVLFSLNFVYSAIIVVSIPILGFLLLRPTKGAFPTKHSFTFFFTIVLGGAVYISCMIYRIGLLLGWPTLDLLHFISIP
jgi:4-hydroxybenzoate polyprenyltransferase